MNDLEFTDFTPDIILLSSNDGRNCVSIWLNFSHFMRPTYCIKVLLQCTFMAKSHRYTYTV